MPSFNSGLFLLLSAWLLGLVAAQAGMPECAALCLQDSLVAQNTCAPTDMQCICTDVPLNTAIQNCVFASCSVKQALTAKNMTETMCGNPIRDNTLTTPIVTGVSGGLAIIGVLIRCVRTDAYFGLDDVFAVASLLFALPMGALEFVMASDGFGKDIWNIPFENIYRIVKFTWLTEIFYFVAIGFTKMSFLFFFLRIFPQKQFRKAVIALLVICVAYILAFAITTIFNCLPVTYIWESWDGEHEGTCINFHVFAWVHAAVNIALDLVIIGLPIPDLLRLSLSTKRKTYLIMMFTVGIFTTIVSIIRLKSLVDFSATTNATYDNVPTAYWSVLEAFVGIFCCCMPAMRRFLATFFPACFGSTNQSYGDSRNKYSNTPNAVISSRGKHTQSKGSIGFGKQHIMKTVDTIVETGSGRSGYDDEVQLVELGLPADGKMGRVTRPSERDQEDDSLKTGSEHNTFYQS